MRDQYLIAVTADVVLIRAATHIVLAKVEVITILQSRFFVERAV